MKGDSGVEVRIVTFRAFDHRAPVGLEKEELSKAVSGRQVLDVREYFLVHGNVPHLALVVMLGGDEGKEKHQDKTASRFRFDVVAKTKTPASEQHHATRTPDDFVRLGELVRVLERVVANECFVTRKGGCECTSCPYATSCKTWHRGRAKIFVGAGQPRAA
jgi:hypothetical protein